MIMIITACAGILSAHPGCIQDEVKLLREVTPQQCIIHGQEYLAKKQPFYAAQGFNVRAYGCRRG